MQLRVLGVTCTKVGLFCLPHIESKSPTLYAKIIFFSHFSWPVQWTSPKRRDCLLSTMMGVTIYCMHFWLWFCKECFVGLYTCICIHDTLTTRQLGCGCLGQEEHLSINCANKGLTLSLNFSYHKIFQNILIAKESWEVEIMWSWILVLDKACGPSKNKIRVWNLVTKNQSGVNNLKILLILIFVWPNWHLS